MGPPAGGDANWLKGVSFSVAAWLLMMIMPMPMAGAGFFGLLLGIGARLQRWCRT